MKNIKSIIISSFFIISHNFYGMGEKDFYAKLDFNVNIAEKLDKSPCNSLSVNSKKITRKKNIHSREEGISCWHATMISESNDRNNIKKIQTMLCSAYQLTPNELKDEIKAQVDSIDLNSASDLSEHLKKSMLARIKISLAAEEIKRNMKIDLNPNVILHSMVSEGNEAFLKKELEEEMFNQCLRNAHAEKIDYMNMPDTEREHYKIASMQIGEINSYFSNISTQRYLEDLTDSSKESTEKCFSKSAWSNIHDIKVSAMVTKPTGQTKVEVFTHAQSRPDQISECLVKDLSEKFHTPISYEIRTDTDIN